jgi:hypothetical protein
MSGTRREFVLTGSGSNNSRDTSVVIATSWVAGVQFPAGVTDFSLFHSVQVGPGAHPASYPMVMRVSLPYLKRPEREADHSPPSSAEVKNGEAVRPLSHTS